MTRGKRVLTTDEQAELHESVSQGAQAGALADFADVIAKGQENQIRKRMFEAIDSPEALDPEKAAQAWIELRAVYKLVAALRRMAKGGETAHSTLQTLMPKDQSP